MKYPFLIQIQWTSSIETILIDEENSPKKDSNFTTTEVWEEAPYQVDYLTRVISHNIEGTRHELKIQYLPDDNPSISELTDCFGVSTITFDTSGEDKNKAKWENNPPNIDYDGVVDKVKLIFGGDLEQLGYTSVLRRKRKQSLFKQKLLKIERACVLTGEIEKSTLEAAHIIEVKDNGGFDESNGFLLRSDLHKLFDKRLLSIDPDSGKAYLSKNVPQGSIYWILVDSWCLKQTTLGRVKKSLLKRAECSS
jgi:hypothetical protein